MPRKSRHKRYTEAVLLLEEVLDAVSRGVQQLLDANSITPTDADAVRKATASLAEVQAQHGVTLREVVEALTALLDEMCCWRDNVADYFASTDRYTRIEECCDALERVVEELDELRWPAAAPDALDDVWAAWIAEWRAFDRGLTSTCSVTDDIEFPSARG